MKTFEHVNVDIGYGDLSTINENDQRKYCTPDGKSYPSITTVLSILKEKELFEWRKRVGEEEANRISSHASKRGTAVHSIIEDYLKNVSNIDKKYMPHIYENFLQVKSVLDDRIGKIYAQEQKLFSHHLRVAGTVDCIAEFDNKLSVIDFKTSRKLKQKSKIENYFMQETAYAIMWEERTRMPITQLVTIIAVDEHPTQVFIEHRDNWTKSLLETIEKFERRKKWRKK